MSARDKLRWLLDKYGVEYKSHYLYTLWYMGKKLYMGIDDANGTLIVDNLTPEQTIAATLICYPIDEIHEIHGTDCPAWKCSVCGDEFPAESNYCSNCGAWVDKEKLRTYPDI